MTSSNTAYDSGSAWFNSIAAVILVALLLLLSGCMTTAPKNDFQFQTTMPVAIAPADPVKTHGSIYSAGKEMVLFEDIKARRVGDILTVFLNEETAASKKATTSTKKGSSLGLTDPTILGRAVTVGGNPILNTSASPQMDFDGEGDSAQSNKLTGSVSVTVVQVLANGNLRIQGEKRISINQGNEYVRFSGIVRSVDITPTNTVSSTLVANATIMYTGDGAVADSNASGWLSRFFISSIFPF